MLAQLGNTMLGTSPVQTMSVADAAIALSCSEDHVRGLIAQKLLPASRIGKRVVIRHSSIEDLLRRNQI
jgi:excisionase family DNA binding protein